VTSCRGFLASTVALILSHRAVAQQAKVWRIGYLAPGLPEDALFFESFREVSARCRTLQSVASRRCFRPVKPSR
jgi:hypothetical protein